MDLDRAGPGWACSRCRSTSGGPASVRVRYVANRLGSPGLGFPGSLRIRGNRLRALSVILKNVVFISKSPRQVSLKRFSGLRK